MYEEVYDPMDDFNITIRQRGGWSKAFRDDNPSLNGFGGPVPADRGTSDDTNRGSDDTNRSSDDTNRGLEELSNRGSELLARSSEELNRDESSSSKLAIETNVLPKEVFTPETSYQLWSSSSNIHAVAPSLEHFFKELYATKPTSWIGPIKTKLLFLLVSRPTMVDAFLYGERSPVALEGNVTGKKRLQDWLRWVTPLFSPNLDEDYDENAEAESAVALMGPGPIDLLNPTMGGKEAEPNTTNPAKTLEKQGILITVTLLYQMFHEGQPERFASQLTQFLNRMQGLGWNESNATRVRDIYKALLTKIENVDALSLKRNFEHPCWDSLLVLVSAIEEFCFLTPLFGFQVQPEPGTVGLHLERFGCADKELLIQCSELLNTKLAVCSESIATIIRDSKDAKDYKKRKEMQVLAGQTAACASKWAEAFATVVEQLGRTPRKTASDSKEATMSPAYEKAVGDLLEQLCKRRGVRKKQAAYIFYVSVDACRRGRLFSKSSRTRTASISRSRRESVSKENVQPEAAQAQVQAQSPPQEEASWGDLLPDAVHEQAKAGAYHLRRMISFLTNALKTQEEFVSASTKAMQKEVKKAYFCPGFDVPPPLPEDGIPGIPEASAVILNLTNALTLRVSSFVEEVSTEVLVPLSELRQAYDEATAQFLQQYTSTEKLIETERIKLLKEFEGVEKEIAELNLVSFEYEEAKKISPAAEKKAAQKKGITAHRTAARVQKYEKASKHFQGFFLPSTKKLLQTHIETMQKMERKRVRCTKLYLNRYLAAFDRFSGAYVPRFGLSVDTVAGLESVRDLNHYATITKHQPAIPPLPQVATSSATILESVPVDSTPIFVTCQHCGSNVDGFSETCSSCGQGSSGGKVSEDKDQQLASLFEVYMEEQGYPDVARVKMRALPSSHKLALLAAANNSKKDAETKTQKHDLPAYWSKCLATPSKVNLTQLKNFKLVIASKATKKWLQEFAAAGGLEHLLNFLELRVEPALKHEALGCLVGIMKNKVGLQIASKVSGPCLSTAVTSPDYSQADKLVILELLNLVAPSEEGKKSLAVAFERSLDALVSFCGAIDACPKCSAALPPYAATCKSCEAVLGTEMPLAAFTLITNVVQAQKDKDTAMGYLIMLEEFGLSAIRKQFREHCQGSAQLMAQCDSFDAFASKAQDLPTRRDLPRAASPPSAPPRSPPTSSQKAPAKNNMFDMFGKMKQGLAAKVRTVTAAKPSPQAAAKTLKDDSIFRASLKPSKCDTCGTDVGLEDVFCTECGASLTPPSPGIVTLPDPAEDPPPPPFTSNPPPPPPSPPLPPRASLDTSTPSPSASPSSTSLYPPPPPLPPLPLRQPTDLANYPPPPPPEPSVCVD